MKYFSLSVYPAALIFILLPNPPLSFSLTLSSTADLGPFRAKWGVSQCKQSDNGAECVTTCQDVIHCRVKLCVCVCVCVTVHACLCKLMNVCVCVCVWVWVCVS